MTRFRAFAPLAAGAVLVLGLLTLIGWIFHIPVLKTVLPGLVSMKANTAICFIMAALSLLLRCRLGPGGAGPWPLSARILGLGVFLAGSLTLSEWVLGWNAGIDQLLFHDDPGQAQISVLGRMAPATAVNFSLLGLALAFLDSGTRRGRWPAQYLVLPTVVITSLAFMGCFYGVEALERFAPYVSIALHTVVGFFLLSTGVLMSRPDRGMMATITGEEPGGVLARRMLLPAVLVPLLAGWMHVLGERAGWYGGGLGAALFSMTLIILFALLIWWSANILNRMNARRKRAEEEIRRNEARFRQMASFPEHNPNPVLELDMARRLLYLNPAARRLFPNLEEQGLGHPWLAGLESAGKALQTVEELATSRDLEVGGRWYRQTIHYVKELQRIHVYGFDVTGNKRAERRADLLAETAGELLTTASPQRVVERLCRKVLEYLDCQAFFNFLVDEPAGRMRLNACAGIPETEARKIEWLDYGTAVCGCAARDRCRVVAENIGETPDPRTELVKSYGIRAYACHPLMVQGRVLGTLSFGARTRARFAEEELSLMKAVADQVAIAMDRQQTQVALKAANEELEQRVAARTAALRAAERYARSLLEASLDPLVTISHTGRITDVNLATETVTGLGRDKLIGSSFSGYFTEAGLAEAGYQKVLAEGTVSDYPLTIRHRSGRTTDVLYNATIYRNEAGEVQGVFAAARDVTERKETERRQGFTNALLALFAQKATANEYLNALVGVIRQWTGCESLGVRLLTEEQEIPYETWAGFERGFLELEHRLSVRHDNCLCIRAVTQVFEESDRALLTPGGSLRSDDGIAFIKGIAPEKLACYRGACMEFGFASLAIVPIRYRQEVIGVIHIADRRPGQFPGAVVEFIESMTPLIGEAIHRFQTEAELAKHRDHLEVLVGQRTGELEAANAQLQIEIGERKQAQETLQQMAEDLRRSNRDLEQFAYVASHDMQEPLRAVGGYARLLERRLSGKLDAKALEYIAGAVDGAARMERLITDLLAFSRVGTRGGALVATDMNGLLAEALRNLQAAIQGARAKVSSAPLPTLPVDPTQIMQLFQNLVGNAIKFRGQGPPEIAVGAQEQDGCWVFSVRDNGIGIEPQYFERIFQLFQRLHTRKHYPGTGIGLAICKKIVERHGGAVWVESRPGQGSTFSFSIPKIDGTIDTAL
jgi:PAS domain S-box-containing protein